MTRRGGARPHQTLEICVEREGIGVAPAGVDGLVRGELGADARLGVVCSSAQSCYAHERTGDALLEDCEGSAVSKGCHATCSSSAQRSAKVREMASHLALQRDQIHEATHVSDARGRNALERVGSVVEFGVAERDEKAVGDELGRSATMTGRLRTSM